MHNNIGWFVVSSCFFTSNTYKVTNYKVSSTTNHNTNYRVDTNKMCVNNAKIWVGPILAKDVYRKNLLTTFLNFMTCPLESSSAACIARSLAILACYVKLIYRTRLMFSTWSLRIITYVITDTTSCIDERNDRLYGPCSRKVISKLPSTYVQFV